MSAEKSGPTMGPLTGNCQVVGLITVLEEIELIENPFRRLSGRSAAKGDPVQIIDSAR